VIERGFEWLARLLFVLVALALFVLAISLVVSGTWQLVRGALGGQIGIYNLMNGVGLLIVSLAIADVAKFVVEENVVRDREMRSPAEALRSLTKFMTIIIIALSLEAVVGSIVRFTRVILLAGKPDSSACLRISASSLAR
jgi:hypothetical protein